MAFILFKIFLFFLSSCNLHLYAQSYLESPFYAFEKELLKKERKLLKEWQLKKDKRLEIKEKLKEVYMKLHNIRHYKAFGELIKRINFQGENIFVLYVGSGAHIAPLEITHDLNIKKAIFYFTEIDYSVIPKIELLLKEIENLGFYKNIDIKIFPLQSQNYEEKIIDRNSSQYEIQNWIKKVIDEKKEIPPIEVTFSFEHKETSVEIHLILKGFSNKKGSTEFYRIEDFEKADLIITHDWSFDPRENLNLLRLFIESACISKKKEIYVMMENLESYPMPIDFKIFNIISSTSLDYGHSYYFTLPDGERVEFEGDFSLYGGGVILKPDLDFFCSLNENQKKVIFDLVTLKEYGFDRSNYDIIGMKKVPAPLVLDLYIGYSYKSIDGKTITSEYLSKILENLMPILKDLKNEKIKAILCSYLKLYKENLKSMSDGSKREKKMLMQDNSLSNPFLTKESTKANMKKAMENIQKIRDKLKEDEKNSKEALYLMQNSLIVKECNLFKNHER